MIGNVLKYMRKSRNYTQETLAKHLNIKSNALSQYETGTRQPTFEVIEEIANFCDFAIYFKDKRTKDIFERKDINRKDI